MLKRFGISYRQYIGMLSEQSNKCAVCEAKPKPFTDLAVDFDLKTKKTRGLVCRKCATVLGLVGDSPKRLHGYINYLLKHGIKEAREDAGSTNVSWEASGSPKPRTCATEPQNPMKLFDKTYV